MSMVYSTDDLSLGNLKYFKYFDFIKTKKPDFNMIAFVIAKDIISEEFNKWYQEHKDWVEIGVHCFEHVRPQEGWRLDQVIWIEKALNILKPYLPSRYLYRAPGFRVLPKTESILKRLGFAGIAHQEFIKYFDTNEFIPVFNTHCTEDKFYNPIGKVWKIIADD